MHPDASITAYLRNEVLGVPVPDLLLIVLCRMLSHHVQLERKGSAALVVAMITGKRLLTSVRSPVLF